MPRFDQLRADMVEQQLRKRGIADPNVLAAMGKVPREAFVPHDLRDFSYSDRPLPVGQQQTISQPYIVALMTEAAAIPPGGRVLEVGTGSGYAAAVASLIASKVCSIERHAPLAATARGRLDRLGYHNVEVIEGDGSRGLPDEAPFDSILVPAGVGTIPEPLRRQLSVGGSMVVPVGGEAFQSLLRVTRTAATEWREVSLGEVRFVPLIGEYGR